MLIFAANGRVLYSRDYPSEPSDLPELTALAEDRDTAIEKGLVVGDKRFEVHRHHDNLVYGRCMDEAPTESEGIAMCKCFAAEGMLTVFAVVTYRMPNVSARMVPKLVDFCKSHIEPLMP